jgi:hypothetical protein
MTSTLQEGYTSLDQAPTTPVLERPTWLPAVEAPETPPTTTTWFRPFGIGLALFAVFVGGIWVGAQSQDDTIAALQTKVDNLTAIAPAGVSLAMEHLAQSPDSALYGYTPITVYGSDYSLAREHLAQAPVDTAAYSLDREHSAQAPLSDAAYSLLREHLTQG